MPARFAMRCAWRRTAAAGSVCRRAPPQEAAVHVVRRAGTWSAEIVGRIEVETDCVEIERLAGEELGCTACGNLRDVPFGLAQAREVVAPVGFELRRQSYPLHLRDVVEHASQPGDEHGQGRKPAFAGRVISVCERSCFDLHGREYRRARSPASWRGLVPTFSERRRLRSFGARESFPAGCAGGFLQMPNSLRVIPGGDAKHRRPGTQGPRGQRVQPLGSG